MELPLRDLNQSTSSDSVSLNELDTSLTEDEATAISLLRQIFPDQSTEELRKLHQQRIEDQRKKLVTAKVSFETLKRTHSSPKSKVGQRIMSQIEAQGKQNQSVQWREQFLPHDFLRLPPSVAVRRLDEDTGQWHYQLITDLASRALEQHALCRSIKGEEGETSAINTEDYVTTAIFRDARVGLGVTLCEHYGSVRVYSLTSRDGRIWKNLLEAQQDSEGPAIQANVSPGDALIGINGTALVEGATPRETLLKHAVTTIQESPDPVVLHFLRNDSLANPDHNRWLPHEEGSCMEITLPDVMPSRRETYNLHSTPLRPVVNRPLIHPFVATLRAKGLLQSFDEERINTLMFNQLTERTEHWESLSFFRLFSPLTDSDIFIPLVGIRKALCVRILNTFLDGDESAYTIWVYDIETGKEWYAPVRYLRDFIDLRGAITRLDASIAELPFPKQPLSIFGSPTREKSPSAQEARCRLLESFLRSLCSLMYTEVLHSSVSEIAVFVQSFLGCETELMDQRFRVGSCTEENFVRKSLKQSLQRYTYRLFLLRGMQDAVNSFIENARTRGPRLEDIESLEAQGRAAVKARAMQDIEEIKTFLDGLQNIILEGCMDDFRSIASREEYKVLRPLFENATGEVAWEALVREAVREQIEIEVYVPLRGFVSRWLVNGWRHEDIEIQFKIKELQKRPHGKLRLPEGKLIAENWSTVYTLLKEGVGHSTLPCVKLRAIVDSAREISRLVTVESKGGLQAGDEKNAVELGADAFLPIFIYCVAKADLDRPCALGVLLKTLCDPLNRMGEIGYFLACFEAAITHIQELDLSDEPSGALSLLSVPLN